MYKDTFKQLYFGTLAELNLMPSELRVAAGGAMLMMGLKHETQDLDAEISPAVFGEITRGKEEKIVELDNGSQYFSLNGEVDLHPVLDLKENGVWVEGVRCTTIEQIIALKKTMNRLKDQSDVILLERLLEQEKAK